MKIMDKLIVNKKIFLFLITISISAITFGSILIVLNKVNINDINTEITNYIDGLNKINYFESFKNIFFSNLFYLISIWLIGISIVGIPLSLILFFIKSFSLGFTISSFILTYKLKGILISIIYVIPCQIINILVIIYLLSFSLIISFNLLDKMFKKQSFNFNFMSKYKKVLIKSIILFLISNLYEIFIMPSLLNLVLHLIK